MPIYGNCKYCGKEYVLYPTPYHVRLEASAQDFAEQPHICHLTIRAKGTEITALAAKLQSVTDQRDAALAALERLRRNALEMAGYVKPYGLDDVGPQSEWSRYSQCRSNIENVTDPAVALSARDARMKSEGKVEAWTEASQWCFEWSAKRTGPGKSTNVPEALYGVGQAFELEAARREAQL